MIPLEALFAAFLGLTTEELTNLIDSGVTNYLGMDLSQFIMSRNPYVAINRPEKPLAAALLKVPGANSSYL